MRVLLSLLVIWNLAAFGDERPTAATLKGEEVLKALQESRTVFYKQYEATKEYAKGYDLVETMMAFNPLDSSNPNDRYVIFSVLFAPENWKELDDYPVIRTEIYLILPSHFERTIRRDALKFYKFESTTDRVRIIPRQPGGSSSAG